MAALRRGFAILGSVTLSGVPKEIRRQLQELHNLYLENEEAIMSEEDDRSSETDPDPEVTNVANGPQATHYTTHSNRTAAEDSSQMNPPPTPYFSTEEKDRSARPADSEVSIPSLELDRPSFTSSPTMDSELWHKRKGTMKDITAAKHVDWKWGPLCTAVDVNNFYEDIRRHTRQ
ncbi:uncharacterized protein LDX57_007738 [Aspergillus melleus]|uniref:uncharacterized protein n=1 Tax=Aspergillus melleus TaxID=138277 RepID=UPI001E8E0023|nr:uncharacterized protein LDX57_007738 [Aspergillus melleus]KAH8430067.1 hypothetical protein LDX57_007738 [Aspergillus melleus]